MAILSIQSHVVYGCAGNSAAVFPMQRLGREVWAINTVEFSNHTGYGAWRGKILGAEIVTELVAGLQERDVLKNCDAILSGYLGDAQAGKAIVDVVKKVRKESPNVLYTCDPVMGDFDRGFYVKPDIPGIFKNELIPLSDIATPNQFELEALTGIEITDTTSAIKAINLLHEMGPSIILVTSFREKKGSLSMITSDKKNIYKTSTAELPLGSGAAGTGDLTCAVFLSLYLETKNLAITLEKCTASVFGILEESYNSFLQEKNSLIELKIIQAQSQLVSPLHYFKAEKIS